MFLGSFDDDGDGDCCDGRDGGGNDEKVDGGMMDENEKGEDAEK